MKINGFSPRKLSILSVLAKAARWTEGVVCNSVKLLEESQNIIVLLHWYMWCAIQFLDIIPERSNWAGQLTKKGYSIWQKLVAGRRLVSKIRSRIFTVTNVASLHLCMVLSSKHTNGYSFCWKKKSLLKSKKHQSINNVILARTANRVLMRLQN